MPTEPNWLDAREDRAWRAFMHAHRQLSMRLHRDLLQDSGLTEADYVILAALSEHPAGRMPAQELCASLQWEKSRLSHQVRRMQEQGLIAREPNPADARSVLIGLLPAGGGAPPGPAPPPPDPRPPPSWTRRPSTWTASAGISSTFSPPPNSTSSPPSTDESCVTSPRNPSPGKPRPTADPRRARTGAACPSACAHRTFWLTPQPRGPTVELSTFG